jgi:carboxymethylenebutenolidase
LAWHPRGNAPDGTPTGGRRLFVVQPNLYYRAGRSPLLDAAKAFTDETERAELFGFIRQLTPDVVVRDTGA